MESNTLDLRGKYGWNEKDFKALDDFIPRQKSDTLDLRTKEQMLSDEMRRRSEVNFMVETGRFIVMVLAVIAMSLLVVAIQV